ncbi:GyrI-like domain-containing protein [Zavarzinia compransoris]|uniref:GyrI-like domain-containing protein n=1 Tax=Zavarzinia marina TaxID=2911065 RepID=UPI001F1D4BBD|nr:GyrI-like domain-containing protein [Zavarzinia marina]MCF4164562.1 GyrI-like domain-containing protein [Zavarzinia marina]
MQTTEPRPPAPQPAEIRAVDAFTVAGLRGHFTIETVAQIPALWQRFGPHVGHMPGELPGRSFGLSLRPAEAAEGFDYLCAVEVATLDGLPAPFAGIHVPARDWAVFPHTGHISGIAATCGAAMAWCCQAGGPTPEGVEMVEVYGPAFDAATGLGGLEIWVPAP